MHLIVIPVSDFAVCRIQTDEKLLTVAVATIHVVASRLRGCIVEVEVDRTQIAIVAEMKAPFHIRVQGLHRFGVRLPQLVPQRRVDGIFAVGAENGSCWVKGQDSLHCRIPILFPTIMTTFAKFTDCDS